MFFTLEALRARHGDALLIHSGTEQDPTLIMVDGGPSGVYANTLKKRLDDLREARVDDDDPLPIRLLMVSHIDDDHIKGVLDLTRQLRDERTDQQPLSCAIETVWHNSFDDIVGNNLEQFLSEASNTVGAASFTDELPADLPINPYAAMVVVSVPQGRQLRQDAEFLQLEVNGADGPLVMAPSEAPAPIELAEGLEAVVLGPAASEVQEFQEEWDKEIEKRGLAQPNPVDAADYLDKSAYNLASIVVMLRAAGKRMLLTGDARGDHVIAGLESAGLLDADGKIHVDLLKVPHHGSNRNVEQGFFETITADHYVISGDGGHGNPDVETFRFLFDARRSDPRPFTIWLTYDPSEYRAHHGKEYPLAELQELFDAELSDTKKVVAMPEDQDSLKVDLSDPFEG